MANVLVQTPRGVVPKTQLYATIGGGVFRERFDALDIQETGAGTNVGGGAKIELVGPLRLRLDYRVFKFTGDAVHKNPQRFSVGIESGVLRAARAEARALSGRTRDEASLVRRPKL